MDHLTAQPNMSMIYIILDHFASSNSLGLVG